MDVSKEAATKGWTGFQGFDRERLTLIVENLVGEHQTCHR